MKTPNILLSALLAIATSSAFALDLSNNVYPTSYLGAKANIATKSTYTANAGTYMCEFSGEIGVGNVPYKYSGHSMLNMDGIQDTSGFGHYTSPIGKESFMHVTVISTTYDAQLGYVNNAVSCVQRLDVSQTATGSKYVMNKYGVGVSELHWLPDAANPAGCPAQIDQMGWVTDKNGNSFSNKFIATTVNTSPPTYIPSPTDIRSNQTATCMKTGL